MLPNEKVIHPWQPIKVIEDSNQSISLDLWGRRYSYNASLLPNSLISQNTELLASPIRLVGTANGDKICWEDKGCYVIEPSDELVIVNGYAQSDCLISNTTFACEYDGMAWIDIKIMPRGKTVPQVFGLEPFNIRGFSLEQLWLEIPLSRKACSLYSVWPNDHVTDRVEGNDLSENGAIPTNGIGFPFKPVIWFGNEQLGLSIFAESDHFWQPSDSTNTIELINDGDAYTLRLHLLDSVPKSWHCIDELGRNNSCITFSLGLQATPVKPYDEDFIKTRAVHIDCFTKLKGDYYPFLIESMDDQNSELVIDRLERAGINLLILHEKWTKIQNYWQFANETVRDIKNLVALCHGRGIRVIPYFGYELSTQAPEWAEESKQVIQLRVDRQNYTGWYRVPYQREVTACYHSQWGGQLADGILATIDKFNFDGVYLDGTTRPAYCVNTAHGCGYFDSDGTLHGTYPIRSVRNLMKKLYHSIHPQRGLINPHSSGCNLMATLSFSHAVWDGEHIQTTIQQKGLSQFSLEYFRAEYLGRNLGLPVQFIVYEHPPVWTFEQALSLCLIHGVYPRPNSVGHPLDVMENIWNIINKFGIQDAKWQPYWCNDEYVSTSHTSVKVSYYEKSDLDGSVRLLAYIANPSKNPVQNVRVSIHAKVFNRDRISEIYDLQSKESIYDANESICTNLAAFSVKIYQIIL